MKLLKRREINVIQAKERKSQIDEGMALARKVDDIRQLLVREEQNLDTFRNKTLKIVQDEISALLLRKKNLELDITDMEDRLKKYQSKLNKFTSLLDKQ